MLKILRDNIKYLSWILWLVILMFIVFVFVDFGGGLGSSGGGASAAVTVGSRVVSRKEFEREYRRLESQYRDAFGEQWSSELADRLQLPVQALERLVERTLMVDEARRQGIRVGDDDIRRAILEMPALKDTNGRFVGEEQYDRFLRSVGYTTREFEAAVRDDLALDRLTGLLAAGVVVSESDVERTWREQNERVSLRWALSPTASYMADAAPSAGELEGFFVAHAEEFRLPDQRVVDYLLVDEARLRTGIEIAPAELEAAYQQRIDDYITGEEVRARHILIKVDENRDADAASSLIASIRARLDAGETFEALASELSEDPGSRTRGGDLGSFGRGSMVPAFEEAAFGGAAGEIVGPVSTTFGQHLIQVIERRAATTRALSEVEAQLRAELAGERSTAAARSRAESLAAQLAAESSASTATMQALADGEQVFFLTTPAFGADDIVPGIGRDPDFVAAAFALAEGGLSGAVEVARGWAVLRIQQAIPAHVPTLEEVEPRVRAAATRARANDIAMRELSRARAALGENGTLAALAEQLGLETRESGEVARGGSIAGLGAAASVIDAALELPAGALGGPLPLPQGAVLFEVVSREAFDAGRFAEESDALRDTLRDTELGRLTASLLARKREEIGVRYDPDLVQQLGLGRSPDAG
jgi:peptidyl-prolyl cis-trans isomerase D